MNLAQKQFLARPCLQFRFDADWRQLQISEQVRTVQTRLRNLPFYQLSQIHIEKFVLLKLCFTMPSFKRAIKQSSYWSRSSPGSSAFAKAFRFLNEIPYKYSRP